MTTRERLRAAARALSEAGVPDPDYDAGMLMEHVTGEPALKLRSGLGNGLTNEEIAARLREVKRPEKSVSGVLRAYRAGVGGAENGALWLMNQTECSDP